MGIIKVPLDPTAASRVIGNKGENQKALSKKYGVKIHVENNIAHIEGRQSEEAADAIRRLQQEKLNDIQRITRLREERKNRVCKYWVEDGLCSYGDSCHFMHPIADGGAAR